MNILEEIIANKKKEIVFQKEQVSINLLINKIDLLKENKRSFRQQLVESNTGIIAEFKRKSPSKGWIFENADVECITYAYQEAGATAISILTDETFFGGSLNDFNIARKQISLPMLRKDFIVDEYQVYQTKALDADVVLLIAAALTLEESKNLSSLAKQLGLEVLLEIHNESELDYVQEDIDVVGINNRNLSSFVTDTKCSLYLGEKIPEEFVKISESGIYDVQTVKELRQCGFKGFLIGENFMKTNEPEVALKQFILQLESC